MTYLSSIYVAPPSVAAPVVAPSSSPIAAPTSTSSPQNLLLHVVSTTSNTCAANTSAVQSVQTYSEGDCVQVDITAFVKFSCAGGNPSAASYQSQDCTGPSSPSDLSGCFQQAPSPLYASSSCSSAVQTNSLGASYVTVLHWGTNSSACLNSTAASAIVSSAPGLTRAFQVPIGRCFRADSPGNPFPFPYQYVNAFTNGTIVTSFYSADGCGSASFVGSDTEQRTCRF